MKLFWNQCCIALISLGLFQPVWAQFQNLNPTGADCIDPTGFLNCYSTLDTQLNSCVSWFCAQFVNTESYDDCLLSCGDVQLAQHIGCWIQSCWNMVFWSDCLFIEVYHTEIYRYTRANTKAHAFNIWLLSREDCCRILFISHSTLLHLTSQELREAAVSILFEIDAPIG